MTPADGAARSAPARGVQAARAKRAQGIARRTVAREARWREQRFSVPYRTDGPKITLGVVWFGAIVLAVLRSPLAVLIVAVPVAVVAGLQAGDAWARHTLSDRRLAAFLAFTTSIGAVAGTFGLGLGLALSAIAALAYAAFGVRYPTSARSTRRDQIIRFAEVLIRSALPVGLAAGSLSALTRIEPEAALALVLLVSAYEAGDFLVGTGSANAVEGPVAGIVTLSVVAFGLSLVLPEPFDTRQLWLFAILAALCCPIGQIAGSAVLPRGDAWAPAVRRLDSYLLAAPLWLLLL